MKKLSIIFVLISLTGLVFFLIDTASSVKKRYNIGGSLKCEVFEKFKGIGISGVIKSKYKDKLNHNVETIEVSIMNGESEFHFFNADKSGVYQFINVGDSINKPENSAEIEVFRNGKDYKFISDYGCNY